MGSRHTPNGLGHPARSGNRKAGATRYGLLLHHGAHRDVIHVDHVLPERFDINLRPVGRCVGFEYPHDLGDRRERGVSRLPRSHGRIGGVLHAGGVHVILSLHRERQEGKGEEAEGQAA